MAACNDLCFGDDYQTNFDVAVYLARVYRSVEGDASLSCKREWFELNAKWVETFSSGQIGGQRLLEFGCGPSIHTVIPSSRRFDEIYMSEYAAPNRQAVQDWIDRKSTAHDWTPFFKFVAEKEGQGATHQEIEARLRGKIKGIVPCDIYKDNLFEPNHFEPEFFDCITSSFCLEAACKTEEDYQAGLKKLSSYLKPGGHLIMCSGLNESYYQVGNKLFRSLPISSECLREFLEDAGFVVLNYVEYDIDPNCEDYKNDVERWYFLSCMKKK